MAVSGFDAIGHQIDRAASTITQTSGFNAIGGLKWEDIIVPDDTWTEQDIIADTWTNQANPDTSWTDLQTSTTWSDQSNPSTTWNELSEQDAA